MFPHSKGKPLAAPTRASSCVARAGLPPRREYGYLLAEVSVNCILLYDINFARLTGASLRVVLGSPPAAHDSQSRGLSNSFRSGVQFRSRAAAKEPITPLRRQRFLPVGRGERRPTFQRKPLSEVPLRAPPKQTAQARAKHPGWAE